MNASIYSVIWNISPNKHKSFLDLSRRSTAIFFYCQVMHLTLKYFIVFIILDIILISTLIFIRHSLLFMWFKTFLWLFDNWAQMQIALVKGYFYSFKYIWESGKNRISLYCFLIVMSMLRFCNEIKFRFSRWLSNTRSGSCELHKRCFNNHSLNRDLTNYHR